MLIYFIYSSVYTLIPKLIVYPSLPFPFGSCRFVFYVCESIYVFSAVTKNEIIPFAATWMDLEIIILSEVRQRQNHMILLICGILKTDKNELIYKAELEPQI